LPFIFFRFDFLNQKKRKLKIHSVHLGIIDDAPIEDLHEIISHRAVPIPPPSYDSVEDTLPSYQTTIEIPPEMTQVIPSTTTASPNPPINDLQPLPSPSHPSASSDSHCQSQPRSHNQTQMHSQLS